MSRRIPLLLVAAVLLAARGNAPLAAQQPLPLLQPSQAVNGSLTDADPKLMRHGAFEAYRFQAREGMVYRISLRSGTFDAYLMIAQPVGGITDMIEQDDDGGDGSDAELVFYPPATGEYVVIATSYPEDHGLGPFSLLLEEFVEEPIVTRPLSLGQEVQGNLNPATAYGGAVTRGYLYDDYEVRAQADQVLWIELSSQQFDPMVLFGELYQGRFREIDADDDSGGDLNARLFVSAPLDGSYVIRVSSSTAGEQGAYTLRVAEATGASAPVTRPIRAGEPVHATLTPEDAALPSGEFHQHWTYTATAGERVVITLESADFDAYLYLGRVVGGDFIELASDDDGAGGTDSQIEMVLDQPGEYVIRATTFSRWATGDYTLRVSSSRGGQVDD